MKGTVHGGSVKVVRSITRAEEVVEKSDSAIEAITDLERSEDMVNDSGRQREERQGREEVVEMEGRCA